MLGLPLGVGQGNNRSCQSPVRLSMWAYNDAHIIADVTWAARDDENHHATSEGPGDFVQESHLV